MKNSRENFMTRVDPLHYCDHGHSTFEEVRLLPYGKSGANMILCRDHFDAEMKYRKERTTGGEYYKASQILKWDNLKVYEG
jgi:hypothetical protein